MSSDSFQRTGGPAFPAKWYEISPGGNVTVERDCPGMTLRDWFAGQTLIGMGLWLPNTYADSAASPEGLKSRAAFAYAQADAMLKVRNDQ